ncbi:interferon-induced very large GTPase 1-like [Lethenteron reissneri]|uniref:interferon-induced very large GTPase 1-like n=1 Tax=Lethenteron reissneri TaxID=7753 RepID=UPI002AB6410E|nr:interferon-induced very large GTPase 1-like [Lethenteron reissneri]
MAHYSRGNQTVKLIRWEKPVLKTILSRDVSFFLDALDRHEFITRPIYHRAKDMPVQEDSANFILDHFIDGGETACQNLLSVLKEIHKHYPPLKDWLDRLSPPGETNSVTFFQILHELNLSQCYGDKMQRGDEDKMQRADEDKMRWRYGDKMRRRDVVTLSRRRKHPSSLEEVARHFVQDVMMTNPESRSASTARAARRASSASASDRISDGFINPLDLEVAVLLCADHPLQDDLMHKMSACRFALPLLLPDAGRGVVTLKLCAARHVARQWRGWQISTRRTGWRDARGDGRSPALVLRMPCVAFARFGRGGGGSKSELLNLIVGGRGHEAFVHRDTAQGDVPRVVADGLVEISPYFPGAEADAEEEEDARSPFCALNLRGDAADSRLERQFGFLRAASVATFLFVGGDVVRKSAERCRALLAGAATPVFLLTDFEDGEDAESAVSGILSTLPGTKVADVNRRGQNKASFASRLRSKIATLLANTRTAGSTPAEMERLARERGIQVDGWPGSPAADEVVSEVADLGVALYKRERLPRQGGKRPSRPGRRDDPRLGVRASGARLAAPTFLRRLLEEPADDPAAFLRRLAVELDERSAVVLSLAGRDEAARDSCLGAEHFLREVAWAYEAAYEAAYKAAYEAARGVVGGVSGDDDDDLRRAPEIGARLLLSGSPLELVDVDGGSVPAKWLADVLGAAGRELGDPTVFVLSALGPHRAETFALLNTTLGSRFPAGGGGAGGGAVRGAFATLVAVEGGGDAAAAPGYVLAVSVEGLASPGPASPERDGELVAFAIAVSHVALVILEGNAGGEDSLEGDVVRALLRTGGRQRKEAACIFARERALLKRFAAVTLAGKEGDEGSRGRLADVVGHSENYLYLPSPWHGTPPMAAVSAEYVQGVRHLRSRLMERVQRVAAPGRVRLSTLARLVEQAWNDVKREGALSTDTDGS